MLNSKYKLIIFDCDGVLVDSEPLSNRIFTDKINGLGLNLSYEESEKLFTGRSDKDCLDIVSGKLGYPVPIEFMSDFNKEVLVTIETQLTAVKHVEKVLKSLCDSSIPICVGSNAPVDKVRKSLNVTNLLSFFKDNIFTVQDVKHGKPYPDIYLYAAEKMGIDPEYCAVIEDSVYGVRAGIAAGMTVYGYCERSGKKSIKKEGAIVFDNMQKLIELLNH